MNIHEKLNREKENNRKLQLQLEKISEKKKASDASTLCIKVIELFSLSS